MCGRPHAADINEVSCSREVDLLDDRAQGWSSERRQIRELQLQMQRITKQRDRLLGHLHDQDVRQESAIDVLSDEEDFRQEPGEPSVDATRLGEDDKSHEKLFSSLDSASVLMARSSSGRELATIQEGETAR